MSSKTDRELADEYWDGFKRREQSVIVDLFYGQLKSKVQCARCGHTSLTFEPFNVLTLPVPTMKNISLNFKYIPYAYDQVCQPIEFAMSVDEHMTIYELKKKLQDYFVKY